MPSIPPKDLGSVVGLGKAILSGVGGAKTAAFTQILPGAGGRVSRSGQGQGRSDSGSAIVRNPRQATAIYDIGGVGAPRPKGLFYARFIRGDNGEGIKAWERAHGFLVRTVDQPTITPKTELLNQYNKKRQVFTGYEIAPIGMTLTDTADAMILQMWNDYVRYYFGDFRQDARVFTYDAVPLKKEALPGSDTGLGFSPRMRTVADADDQFYFSALEIYQVFRNAFTKTTLVNPRIVSFDPDELDYSSSDPSTFRLQVAYEAVLYENEGVPQEIDGSDVAEAFADIRLHGDIINLPGPAIAAPITGKPGEVGMGSTVRFPGVDGAFPFPGQPRSNKSGVGGVLGAFGNFNFGQVAGTVVRSVISGERRNLASDLAMAATGNTQLATVLGMIQAKEKKTAIAGQIVYGLGQSGTISPLVHDVAQAAVAKASGHRLAAGILAGQVVEGVIATATHQNATPGQQVSNNNGLSMTPETYDVVNSKRPAGAQIGFRGQNPGE